ncbi:MAG TPA: SRPBCC family protein [Gammaproteobacteria bacterium]|nr:SRPBCC family protein [Gammaproteobacteria bacterium]
MLVALCLLPAARSQAAVISQLEVSQHGNRYRATAIAQLCVTPAQAYAALLDFADFPRMNPAIRKAVVIRSLSPDSQLVYMETRACIGLFCRTLKQVQQFTELSASDLVAVTLPERSNVKQSSSSWHLEANAAGTRVYWRTSLEPAFWVPPLIGPRLVRAVLLQQGRAFMTGIERLNGRLPCPAN